jgi:hypothetical protein
MEAFENGMAIMGWSGSCKVSSKAVSFGVEQGRVLRCRGWFAERSLPHWTSGQSRSSRAPLGLGLPGRRQTASGLSWVSQAVFLDTRVQHGRVLESVVPVVDGSSPHGPPLAPYLSPDPTSVENSAASE